MLTHRVPAKPVPGITFVADLPAGVAAARAVAGDKYVNVMGASVAMQCLQAGELDQVLTLIAPVLLGDGVRLFEHPGGMQVGLERIKIMEAPLATGLWYRVVR